ncbi:Rhodanese-related sulfurtransferase [Malassezia pachydermatis]|uniref:Ribosome biogenesis regulatory protein n=1 Tax=Malassezia pachydermatis TaxID=77020 RepID=A0A0M9VPA6_9BASI|nr:rrs1-regulator of ribosome biogenesis [Malassezia pachydermatis]KOS14233.1 rrs1-regulator of ribosome biogenesis [Malassezia pachydermatis]
MAAAVSTSTAVEQGETPLQLDAGLLASLDVNPLDVRAYKKDREALLQSRTRNATQHLINTLFQFPIQRDATYGPLATLPAFETALPREKPLPKPKPLTKWEKFAKAKGIVKRKKDRMIYDEERGEWVPRWGYQGANKQLENQWLVEVPNNADDDFRPDKAAAKERKERRLKNEKQHQRNLARQAGEAAATAAAPKSELGSGVAPSRARRRAELEAELLRARGSTASMGRFDTKLEGESKPRGVKRTFQPNEIDASKERAAHMQLLAKMDKGGGSEMNLRKAIKFASKGQGSKALGEKVAKRRK